MGIRCVALSYRCDMCMPSVLSLATSSPPNLSHGGGRSSREVSASEENNAVCYIWREKQVKLTQPYFPPNSPYSGYPLDPVPPSGMVASIVVLGQTTSTPKSRLVCQCSTAKKAFDTCCGVLWLRLNALISYSSGHNRVWEACSSLARAMDVLFVSRRPENEFSWSLKDIFRSIFSFRVTTFCRVSFLFSPFKYYTSCKSRVVQLARCCVHLFS